MFTVASGRALVKCGSSGTRSWSNRPPASYCDMHMGEADTERWIAWALGPTIIGAPGFLAPWFRSRSLDYFLVLKDH